MLSQTHWTQSESPLDGVIGVAGLEAFSQISMPLPRETSFTSGSRAWANEKSAIDDSLKAFFTDHNDLHTHGSVTVSFSNKQYCSPQSIPACRLS